MIGTIQKNNSPKCLRQSGKTVGTDLMVIDFLELVRNRKRYLGFCEKMEGALVH